MPRVSDLGTSNYFAQKDTDGGPLVLKIARYAHETIENDNGKEEKWVLYFDGHDKGLILKPTIGSLIEEITGSDDFDHWIDKTIELYTDSSIMFAGKRTGGLRVRKPSNGVSQQQASQPNDLIKEAKLDAWRKFCKKHSGKDADWWKANFTVAVDTYFQGMNPNAINLAQWRKFIDDGFEPKAPLELAEAGGPGGFSDADIPFHHGFSPVML